jgi:hypothetical protein
MASTTDCQHLETIGFAVVVDNCQSRSERRASYSDYEFAGRYVALGAEEPVEEGPVGSRQMQGEREVPDSGVVMLGVAADVSVKHFHSIND